MAAIFIEAVRNDGTGYVKISEFQNQPGIGLGCNCYCPECGSAVGARIFSGSPESSCFFHRADEYNKNCNGGAPETELHLLAKKIFEQHTEVCLPEPENESKAVKLRYSSSKFEKRIGSFRPDIILTSDLEEELIIEITVTHRTFTNPIKMQKLSDWGVPAIEITLDRNLISSLIINSGIPLDSLVFAKFYKPILIDEIKKKRWLVKPKSNLTLEQSIEKVKSDDSNAGWWIVLVIIILIIGYCITRKSPKNKFRQKYL